MPIYEYSCKKCNEVFSVFQSMNAGEKDTKCPKCGSSDVVKKISSFSCCSPAGGGAAAHGGFSGGG
ncbi:MAG: zinc ribbon domain-containing protein [Thermodesulfovibrionales bacterium]